MQPIIGLLIEQSTVFLPQPTNSMFNNHFTAILVLRSHSARPLPLPWTPLIGEKPESYTANSLPFHVGLKVKRTSRKELPVLLGEVGRDFKEHEVFSNICFCDIPCDI